MIGDDGMVSAEADMLIALMAVQAGTAVVTPHGSTVAPINPTGNGEAYREAIKVFDAQIARAIVLSERVVFEAVHGSKADGEKAQDAMGSLVRQIRRTLAWTVYRQGLHHAVALNFGPDVAATHTPYFCLGETEHQDWADVAGAVATLTRAGYFAPSQLPAVDARLGLPIREPGETAEHEAEEDAETEDEGESEDAGNESEDEEE
jgi:phage gp29-like protein